MSFQKLLRVKKQLFAMLLLTVLLLSVAVISSTQQTAAAFDSDRDPKLEPVISGNLPDLTVFQAVLVYDDTGICTPSNELPTAIIEVANIGAANAGTFTVSIGNRETTVTGLSADTSTVISFSDFVIGNNTVFVDSSNVVVESNESNNSSQAAIVSTLPACETPWQTSSPSTPIPNAITGRWEMGYNFTPETDGFVTALGGFFNGTKVVSLFEVGVAEPLATVDVTSNNSWGYTEIEPIFVELTRQYSVVVYLDGEGGSVVTNVNLPMSSGGVSIDSTTFAYEGYPPTTETIIMFGQADIMFTPE